MRLKLAPRNPYLISSIAGSSTCFACGEHGDIFTLYAKLNNLSLTSNFPQIVNDLERKFHLSSSRFESGKKNDTKDYSQLFIKAEQQLNQTDYLTKRGISPEIQRKFHCKKAGKNLFVQVKTHNKSAPWRSLISP